MSCQAPSCTLTPLALLLCHQGGRVMTLSGPIRPCQQHCQHRQPLPNNNRSSSDWGINIKVQRRKWERVPDQIGGLSAANRQPHLQELMHTSQKWTDQSLSFFVAKGSLAHIVQLTVLSNWLESFLCYQGPIFWDNFFSGLPHHHNHFWQVFLRPELLVIVCGPFFLKLLHQPHFLKSSLNHWDEEGFEINQGSSW